MFDDRADAGRRLASAVAEALEGTSAPVVVYGIARGGVIVAREVADALGVPLDVAVVRKLGAPGQPEYGIGAIAPGIVVLDEGVVARLRVSPAFLQQEIAEQEAELERRASVYRTDPISPAGSAAVIVDDGIATGSTAVAAARWARAQGASSVIVAAPTAAPEAAAHLGEEADAVVILETPRAFRSVGQFYRAFAQTTDDQVRTAMRGRS